MTVLPTPPNNWEMCIALARFEYGVRLTPRDVEVLDWLAFSLDSAVDAVLEEEDEVTHR